MTGEADEPLTIDELAQRSGLPSSTIRLYQGRGLLPPPARRGRVAYYGPGHLARLDLVARLQERGFSLAAIAELVAGWQEGRSLDDVLGLERTVPALVEEPLVLTLAELAARFPEGAITPESVAGVVRRGLVETGPDGSTVVVRSPTFLDVGSSLVALGFPLEEVLDESEVLEAAIDAITARFTALFERHVWRPFADAGMPAEELPRVTAVLAALGPLADRVVQATLRRSIALAAERFVAAEAAAREA